MMRRHNRRGITLVELLVLAAIVSVLVVLLLPAVQTARAAAREATCVNNLKQIGLALHNYHDAFGIFPMSDTRGAGHAQGHSAFMLLLPFLEDSRIYNAYNFWQENWHASNNTAAATRVTTFLCPDNPDDKNVPASEVRFPESRSTFAKTHFGANWGGGRGPWGEDFVKERGTYLGVMMSVITPDGLVKGPDGQPKARCVRIKDITDGTSFTLAMVEKRDSFGWAVGGWGGSEFDVYTSPAYAGDEPLARKVYSGSTHTQGPSALLCDGSVRRLLAHQNRQVWYALITRAGGEIIKPEE